MGTLRNDILCIVSVLVLAGAAAQGQDESLARTRTAGCIVRITVDASILTLTPATLESLIGSSGVAGAAARDTLDLSHPEVDLIEVLDGIEIEWLAQSQQTSDPFRPRATATVDLLRKQDVVPPSLDMLGTPEPADREREEPAADDSRGLSSRTEDPTGGRGGYRRAMIGGGSGGMGGYDAMGGMMGRGMGGGMMGGMDGGMMGGTYGMATPPSQTASLQQSATVRLRVLLPEGIKPAAEDFLNEVVTNLREVLESAHNRHQNELLDLVNRATHTQEFAAEELARLLGGHSASEADRISQADEIVDLSVLTPEMPFGEAIKVLANSVEPPLKIVVMWRDLLDNADIDPSTPIDMDGPRSVKLGTALDLLLQAVSGAMGNVVYEMEDDVAVVKAAAGHDAGQAATGKRVADVDVQNLVARRRELTRSLQNIEIDLASMEARRKALERQILVTREEMARRQSDDEITQELAKILQTNEELMSNLEKQVKAGRLGASELAKARQDVMQARVELARRREELAKSATGSQLSTFSSELSEMAIDRAESIARFEVLRKQLDEVERQLEEASKFDPRAARIRAAKEAVSIAEQRVARLQRQLALLEPPVVLVIGAN